MIGFIKHSARILAYSLALYLILVLWMEKLLFNPSSTLGTNKVATSVSIKGHPYSTVILGDSRAESDYIPSTLDSNAFNFGLSGTGNKLWRAPLEHECIHYPEKRRLIVNLDIFQHPGDGQDYRPTYYLKVQARNPIYDALADTTKARLTNWPWWYIGQMRYFLRESLKDRMGDGDLRGYKPNRHHLSDAEFELGMPTHHFNAPFHADRWEPIFEMIDSSGDEVFFVVAPIHHSRLQYLNLDSLDRAMEQATSRYPHIHYLNLSTSVVEKELFYDPLHLNQQGAERFSALLRDTLALAPERE